ncbi:tail fiber domain-containing protein [Paraburkholderia sediminicola]|uniref:tail fiber domain-containing protein n=1 Tax=Paraburkholderia sediminicola TaxID=458836 RepID=UPI0038B7AB01
MPMYQWSTTPASNASAGAINWAEGQPPSTVNDSARQMMADVATWFAGPEWLNYGLTPTYVSATQYTIAGNQTTIFSVGRRVRAAVTAGTIYGTITASAFTSLTTVTVGWDSGNLDSGLSEVDVGMLNPLFSSFPAFLNPQFGATPIFTTNGILATVSLNVFNTNTHGNWFLDTSGNVGFFDNSRSLTRFQSDTAGNFTAAGNITAFSDERLKTDWADLPFDFIDRLAAVKRGTFTRLDSGERQVGVGAQSLQQLLPEAVQEVNDRLAVAYGQAALVACVELAAEVVRLRALLEPVK